MQGSLFWNTIMFFFLFMYIMVFFQVIGDLFRDSELGGFAKFLWVLFMLAAPFLSVFIYLIARGDGMAKRGIAAQQEMQQQMDDYVKTTAGSGNAADQIEKAKGLLDSGAISQAEFDAIKAKAIS